MGQGLRVLVTRPDGERTAARVRALGHEPIMLPLSSVVGLEPQPTALASGAQAAAATSANALRFAAPELIEALRRLPFFAVGPATARAAVAAGFERIVTGPGDALGLARVIAGQGRVSPLAYLCGRVRRPEFEAALASGAVEVRSLEIYDTRPLPVAPADLPAALGSAPVHAALLFSAAAAEAFRPLRTQPLIEGTQVLALSPRIADAAGGGLAAAVPNEDGLFAFFEAWAGSFQAGPVW